MSACCVAGIAGRTLDWRDFTRLLRRGDCPMEIFILGIVVLAFYLFVRTLSKSASWISGSRFRAYRHLADRYRGRYENRGMTDPPTVSFSYKGASVRVGLAPHVAGQPNLPRTRVVIRFA